MGAAKNRRALGLIAAVRERAFENRHGLYVPTTEGDVKTATWPVCEKCHHDVESVNVEDVSTDRVTIRAKCHGEEAVLVVEFPYRIRSEDDEIEWSHIQSAINSSVFFSPSIVL